MRMKQYVMLGLVCSLFVACTSVVNLPTKKRLAFEPEMISIPQGSFTMGCLNDRDVVDKLGCYPNETIHDVQVKTFYIGKYEVTFDEWDVCEQAKACPHAADEGWGRGKQPLINVSWQDAQIYIKWLNQQTGKHYRLPTEAEWEYAARGGKASAYPWGNNQVNCANARYNLHDCHVKSPIKVGSYRANGFGLHDTAGNVWEWVQDRYTTVNSASMPVGVSQVIRGGAWYNSATHIRSAFRSYELPSRRSAYIGLRLALDSL